MANQDLTNHSPARSQVSPTLQSREVGVILKINFYSATTDFYSENTKTFTVVPDVFCQQFHHRHHTMKHKDSRQVNSPVQVNTCGITVVYKDLKRTLMCESEGH